MATHHNVIIIYYKYNMIFYIQSDASYLTEKKVRSMILVKYLLFSIQSKTDPINLNGETHTMCSILKYVAASSEELELGGLFNMSRIQKMICLTLIELGHTQPPKPLHTDNSTAAVIVNNTVKIKIS